MRLIDADYLLSTFQAVCSAVSCEECRAKYKNGTCKLEHWLKAQPTIEERKQGKWRVYEGEMTCSCCETTFYTDMCEYIDGNVPKFCPECGADMKGEETDAEIH